jgi:hypothetical protein
MGGSESAGDNVEASQPRLAEWADWPDEKLLDLRLCDLDLTVEGSQIAAHIRQLNDELAARGLLFRPHFWLSSEWFSPDGVPGIAVPFYLAHPRLARLELGQMLEVEGGTPEACLRILRHEAGHALENAYRLRRRRDRQAVFGRPIDPVLSEILHAQTLQQELRAASRHVVRAEPSR